MTVTFVAGQSFRRAYFRRTSPFVVLAILATSMYLYVTQWSELTTVGGFTLHITDLLFAVMAAYCIADALTGWYRSIPEPMLLVVALVLVLSFARGGAASNLQDAGVDVGMFSGFIAAAVFAYFWGRELNVDWVFDRIVWLSWAIVVLGAARLAVGVNAFVLRPAVEEALRNPSYMWALNHPEVAAQWANPRILDPTAAFMLGQGSLIALNRAGSAPPGQRRRSNAISFFVFVVILLISDQRTATFATLSGLVIIIAGLQIRAMIGIASAILIAGGSSLACYG